MALGQILYQTFIKFSVFLYRWWNSLQSENNDSSALVYTESERKRDQKRKKRITLSNMELAFIWHSESGGISYVFVEEPSTPE